MLGNIVTNPNLLEDNDKRNKMKNSSLEIGNKISITDYYNDFITQTIPA